MSNANVNPKTDRRRSYRFLEIECRYRAPVSHTLTRIGYGTWFLQTPAQRTLWRHARASANVTSEYRITASVAGAQFESIGAVHSQYEFTELP